MKELGVGHARGAPGSTTAIYGFASTETHILLSKICPMNINICLWMLPFLCHPLHVILSAFSLQLYKGDTPPKLVLCWHIVNLGPFIDKEVEPSSVNVSVGYSMDL